MADVQSGTVIPSLPPLLVESATLIVVLLPDGEEALQEVAVLILDGIFERHKLLDALTTQRAAEALRRLLVLAFHPL